MNKSEAGKLGHFASKTKLSKQFNDRVSLYSKNPNRCRLCGEPFEYSKRKNKFCSHSCAARYNNGARTKKNKEDKFCIKCSKKIARHAKYFCSNKCQAIYNQKKKWSEWTRTGVATGSVTSIKKFILHYQGRQCCICGLHEWMDEVIPLVMDHINGNPNDNRIVNLRLVCGNCDMQLPTYKSKNNGKGRHSRRKRYSEGKSY